MPKDYISREDAISCVKHAWAKGLEPTQYLEELDAIDVACVNFEDKDCDGEQLCACLGIVREKLKKLKEYEDTGLTPEEIKLNMDGLDEYRKAEAEGRLVVPPCKVGDKFYLVSELCNKPPNNWCDCDGKCSDCEDHKPFIAEYSVQTLSQAVAIRDAVGKTVFLTREEAEKALERSKNNGKH